MARKEYIKNALMKKQLSPNPFSQFDMWFSDAKNLGLFEPNAMQLATASKDGKPSCRTVLLKDINEAGFIFYTNYESRKAKELEENPFAYATFLWKELERQVGIEGKVEKIARSDSEKYFFSRPRGSKISAWASRQDSVVASREALDAEYEKQKAQFANIDNIPLPPYWGGYRLIPSRFEFWQGRKNRLHDRFQYNEQHGQWIIERLAP